MNQATTTDYLKNAAALLSVNSKLFPIDATWPHLRDGVLPYLADGERCEAVMPMNIELGADPSPKAGLSNVKPRGKVDLALVSLFQHRTVFLR